VWHSPGFLVLPDREEKPRRRGITHVLDKGMPTPALEAFLARAAELVDVIKIGWGIAYVDPTVKERIALCHQAGVLTCLGGTMLEVVVSQGRLTEFRRWATDLGVDGVEVSNGLGGLSPDAKSGLVRKLSGDFMVLAEAGAKDSRVRVVPDRWIDEMDSDLAAGARWVIAEGRESGTVGLYRSDGVVREGLVERIGARIPLEQVIFETPQKSQQAWFICRYGSQVNLGNIAPDDVLPLEASRA
jgi:phosphosulfolactate synthase